jgi:hypothetical protein
LYVIGRYVHRASLSEARPGPTANESSTIRDLHRVWLTFWPFLSMYASSIVANQRRNMSGSVVPLVVPTDMSTVPAKAGGFETEIANEPLTFNLALPHEKERVVNNRYHTLWQLHLATSVGR